MVPAAEVAGPLLFLGLEACTPLFSFPFLCVGILLLSLVFKRAPPMLADFTTVVSALISFVSFCIEGTDTLSVAVADFYLACDRRLPIVTIFFGLESFLTRTPHNSHPFSCKGNAWIHVCSDASHEIIYLSNHWFDTYLEISPLGIYTSAPNIQRNDEFSQTFL